jgi:hypothetical protein
MAKCMMNDKWQLKVNEEKDYQIYLVAFYLLRHLMLNFNDFLIKMNKREAENENKNDCSESSLNAFSQFDE